MSAPTSSPPISSPAIRTAAASRCAWSSTCRWPTSASRCSSSGWPRSAAELELDYKLIDAKRRKRVALFVSRYDHCLLDLLWRWRRDELQMDVVAVVSNHPDLQEEVARFGVPVPPHPGQQGHQGRGRAGADRSALRRGRAGRHGALHADPVRRFPQAHRLPGDQYPPLVPARLRRSRPVSARPPPRREADRRHRALRHRGLGRGPDHRAGRRSASPIARMPPSWSASAPTSSASCSRGRSPGICRIASCCRVTVRSSSSGRGRMGMASQAI